MTDLTPPPTGDAAPPAEPRIVPPDEARARLEDAAHRVLGAGWDDEDSGWSRVTGHDYMARFTKGRTNIDIYVDMFDGSVRVDRSMVHLGQDAGRLVAWVLAGLLLAAALLVVRGMGWL